MRQSIVAWVRAIRPLTLSASVMPVVVGSALAAYDSVFSGGLFVLVLMASVLVQTGTNLTDEYADHMHGKIAQTRIRVSYKVIAQGLLTPHAVLLGAVTCFGLAAAIGICLVLHTVWLLAVVCLASLAVACAYRVGPLPLGSLALGEPLVFVFIGPAMVLVSYYVQAMTLTRLTAWACVPVVCLVTAMMIVNNLRDTEEDLRSGRVTLVALCGRKLVARLYNLLLLVGFSSMIVLVLSSPR